MDSLHPLEYHQKTRGLLQSEYPDIWKWFSSVKAQSDYYQSIELELLKSTYRMERASHENLYQLVDQVRSKLKIDAPVTLYQSQGSSGTSAALYFSPNHAHIVFIGDILDLLNDLETSAVIAHELSHFKLWKLQNGEFMICDQILSAMANEPKAETAQFQSARLFQLYTEIYADQGTLLVVDEETAVSALLKVHTGIKNADAQSYLKQAEDIFANKKHSTEGHSHPELFIRVRALQLLNSEENYTKEIKQLIEGETSIEDLDLISQKELTELTKQFLLLHLQQKWLRSDFILAHVGHFFHELDFDISLNTQVKDSLQQVPTKTKEYFSYILIDLIAVDLELGEGAVAAALLTANMLGFSDILEKLLNRELKILKKEIKRIKEQAAEIVKQTSLESEITHHGSQ